MSKFEKLRGNVSDIALITIAASVGLIVAPVAIVAVIGRAVTRRTRQ